MSESKSDKFIQKNLNLFSRLIEIKIFLGDLMIKRVDEKTHAKFLTSHNVTFIELKNGFK